MELFEINKIVEELSALKERKAHLAEMTSTVNERISKLEGFLTDELTMNNLESYKSPYGTIYKVVHPSVKIEDKQAFHEWLKSKDYFDSIASVNSQTLKAFVKTQEGTEIPGLTVTDFVKLNFRKN
jgi:heme-degrading monooxygenase HmoA